MGVSSKVSILCSNLPNDQDLIASFRHAGCDVTPMPLFTDVAFSGVGEGGKPILVAVERKTLSDLASCMNNGRLLQQIKKVQDYNTDVFALIVEGRYKCSSMPGEAGLVTVPRGASWVPLRPVTTFNRFTQYLVELAWLYGVLVMHSDNSAFTAAMIKAMFANFQRPPGEHKSMDKFCSSAPMVALLSEPGLVRRVAKELPSIGWERSKAVSDRFPTVAAMCAARVKDWAAIPGIGAPTARRIVEALRGTADGDGGTPRRRSRKSKTLTK